jgi:signal transduction histidine kinase
MARGGVVNMSERAHDLGGTFGVGPGTGGPGKLVT